ncbi:MAG: hypothetical protein QME81_09390 [bacterium]|nr:hypothetical protein [bacterium]
MRNIYYDVEGDNLSVTFVEVERQPHTGIELNDNIVLYFNPETEQPIKLLLLSYRRLVEASRKAPLPLDGLNNVPETVRNTVLRMVQRKPVAGFLQVMTEGAAMMPTSRLPQMLTSTALKAVA